MNHTPGLHIPDPPIHPITTTRFSFRNSAGSLSIIAPTFISGPIATSVISPGYLRICSSTKSTAAPCRFPSGRASAYRACVNSVFGSVRSPTATGTLPCPVSPSSRSASLARSSVSPEAVVIPSSSISGLRSASVSANASSMSSPRSVSMITFSGPGAICGHAPVAHSTIPAIAQHRIRNELLTNTSSLPDRSSHRSPSPHVSPGDLAADAPIGGLTNPAHIISLPSSCSRAHSSLPSFSPSPPQPPSPSSTSQLRHIQGTDPVSGIEYARILLPGQLLATSALTPVVFTGTPTLIAQCTRSTSGKMGFDLFVEFGDVTDLDFHAPVAPSPTQPRPQRIDLKLDFSGYTHIPLKRQFESLREPTGMLHYSSPGFHSANLEDAPIVLRYLVALPDLRLTETGRSAAFNTSPLLTEIRSEPLCKAALL